MTSPSQEPTSGRAVILWPRDENRGVREAASEPVTARAAEIALTGTWAGKKIVFRNPSDSLLPYQPIT
jgi:hypothetical protein